MENKIDWKLVNNYSYHGRLADLLEDPKFPPPSCWNQEDYERWTLVHFCGGYRNEKALLMLIKAGCNINHQTFYMSSLAHFACKKLDTIILSILCSAGANLRLKDARGHEPLDIATSKNVKMLLANGIRLRYTTRKHKKKWILFEQGVIQCRDIIITILGLKKRRRQSMTVIFPKLDRFLVKQELAVAIWSTRYSFIHEK